MNKIQLVEVYENVYEAKQKMDHNRMLGWLVHTCTAFKSAIGQDRILVVYKKEKEQCN